MKTKHIETESAIVNIRSDMEDTEGREVEVIEIMPTKHEGWEIEFPTRNKDYVNYPALKGEACESRPQVDKEAK